MIFGDVVSFHLLFRLVNQSEQVVLAMNVIFSMWIYKLHFLSLSFKLVYLLSLFVKYSSGLIFWILLDLELIIVSLHFDPFKELKLILYLPHLIVHWFFQSLHISHNLDTFLELSLLFVLHLSEFDVFFRDSNVTRSMVQVHSTKVASRGIYDTFLLV